MYVTTTEKVQMNTEIPVFAYVQNCRKDGKKTSFHVELDMFRVGILLCVISHSLVHCNTRLSFV
jgi:hypothetical protein